MPKCYQQQTADHASSRPNSRPPTADKMHICTRPEELPTLDTMPPCTKAEEQKSNAGMLTPSHRHPIRGNAGTIPGNGPKDPNTLTSCRKPKEDPRKQHSRRRKQNSRQPTDISTRTAPHSHITPYLVHRAIFQHCMAIYTTANKRRLKRQIQSHDTLTACTRKRYGPLKSHLQPFKPSPIPKYRDRQKTPLNAVQTAKQPY